MSTFVAKKETVKPNWLVIDASDQVVGRLAVVISNLLRGKHKPEYTPHVDTGDFVIVVNANKVKFTGRKWDTQTYRAYSHYPGGLKRVGAKDLLARKPEMILEQAVKRMMPRSRLARQQFSKLKVYAGPNHPHQAQDPHEYKVEAK
ncbi:MAG TPA: 50S ribosomal protein L13 [Gemmataceae bacterium]|nr:50S ribosomal protein L13 [Gemmataceae bacterium]